jgi:hypothetical protein
MSAHDTLLIVERAHRGSVETQFADVLYSIQELNRQSGGLDLGLRGLAAGYAVTTGFEPVVRVGPRTVTGPDSRATVRRLIEDGVVVWIEEPDLTALGESARGRLLPGVRCLPAHGLVTRWPEYERVWFM